MQPIINHIIASRGHLPDSPNEKRTQTPEVKLGEISLLDFQILELRFNQGIGNFE